MQPYGSVEKCEADTANERYYRKIEIKNYGDKLQIARFASQLAMRERKEKKEKASMGILS